MQGRDKHPSWPQRAPCGETVWTRCQEGPTPQRRQAEKRGINYKGIWTAEVSGWSEHFLTYIAALEGIENKFED